MKKAFLFILLTLLFISVNSPIVYGLKIQKNDTWLYKNTIGKTYNETATGIEQYVSTDTLALAKVKSNRTVYFQYNFDILTNKSVVGNGTIKSMRLFYAKTFINKSVSDSLYLTQEGGFPIFDNAKYSGYIKYKEANFYRYNSTKYEWTNYSYTAIITKQKFFVTNPAKAFATAESVKFVRTLGLDTINNETNGYSNQIIIDNQYVLSTNQPQSVLIRNYTLTPFSIKFYFGQAVSSITPYALNNVTVPSLEMTWDSNIKLPVYIKHTVPAKIKTASGISLAQFTPTVFQELFLVKNRITTNTNKLRINLLLMLSVLFIIIIPIKKRKNK